MSMYWDINETLSYNALFNFIIGNRGGGKTYGAKKKSIQNFIEKGEQFVYVRRYKEELKKASSKLFDDVKREFEGNKFEYKNGLFLINDKIGGFPIPLSVAKSQKSNSFPLVTTILYDEFIVDKGNIRYLNDEVNCFLELYETIARPGTDHPLVKVFFLANAITWTNPYMLYFDLKKPQNKKQITVKDDILVQMVSKAEFVEAKKSTRFGKIIDGTDYAKYSIENEFLRDNDSFVTTEKPQKANYFFTIKAAGEMYGVWNCFDDGILYVSHKYEPSCKIVFTTILENHQPNLMLLKGANKSAIFTSFAKAFKLGIVWFDSVKTKNVVIDTIKNML